MTLFRAPAGIAAHFSGTGGEQPVIAFSDTGEAFILGDKGLVPAKKYGNFEYLTDSPGWNKPVMLIPGGGWRVKHESGVDLPIVAWALDAAGGVTALTDEDDGSAVSLSGYRNFRVYHPDETDTGTEST
jgi:hypothetical protein